MKTFNSIDEILDFAINSEQSAFNFYTKLAANSENTAMKEVFHEFFLHDESQYFLFQPKCYKFFSLSLLVHLW